MKDGALTLRTMRVEPVAIGHLDFVRLVWTQLLGEGWGKGEKGI